MNISKRLMLTLTVLSSFLLLAGCGEDDSSTASAPAPAAAPAAASAPAQAESDPLAGVERAEGVVYMDEIYANWPYN